MEDSLFLIISLEELLSWLNISLFELLTILKNLLLDLTLEFSFKVKFLFIVLLSSSKSFNNLTKFLFLFCSILALILKLFSILYWILLSNFLFNKFSVLLNWINSSGEISLLILSSLLISLLSSEKLIKFSFFFSIS